MRVGEGCVVAPGCPTSCRTPDKWTCSVNPATISRNESFPQLLPRFVADIFIVIEDVFRYLQRFSYCHCFRMSHNLDHSCCLVSCPVPNSLCRFQNFLCLFSVYGLSVPSSDRVFRHVYPRGVSIFSYTEVSSTL
jgi:hypothetical protein